MICDCKDIGFEDPDRNSEDLCILLDLLPVGFTVAGIHDQEFSLKGDLGMLGKDLKHLGHAETVLAAGDTYGDAVIWLDQLIAVDGSEKWCPEVCLVGLDDAALYLFHASQFFCHNQVSFLI